MLVEATSVKTVADRVFNLLKGYGFQIDTYNKAGEVVGDPADAIRFFVEDPNLLVTLNVPREEIRLSISGNTDQTDTLRKQLDEIAKDYLMMLDFRVFGKTLKPSSEAINIRRDEDMKEQNELRRLAGLPIKEERTVVGCNDDQSLYIFLNNGMVDLGKTEEAIASKLHELGDVIDFDDMYYSSSMDFAKECGFKDVQKYDNRYALGLGIHEMGTARMGKDPKNSVLNKWNQVHACKNVFITDGSCMTSSSCVNPSITYMALTARAANYAINELKKGNL